MQDVGRGDGGRRLGACRTGMGESPNSAELGVPVANSAVALGEREHHRRSGDAVSFRA